MKIAYCIGALNLGGIGTVAKNLSDYFESKNIDFCIITTHREGNFFSQALSLGWRVKDISKNEPSLRKRLNATINTLQEYDVIINNHSIEVMLCLSVLPADIIKISVQHNTTIKSSKILAFNSEYLHCWAGVSPSVIDVVQKYNPNYKRLVVLPNGVPNFSLKKKKGFKKGVIRIVYVGRIDQKKNIFLLPKLFSEIEKSGFKVELFIAGDGEHKNKLEESFDRIPKRGDVIFMGRIGTDTIKTLFAECDFLINISLREGLPMVVLEGMSSGIIPILSNIGPHQYALGDEIAELLLDKDDIDSYARIIIKLRENNKLYEEIRKKIIKRWENYFSIDAFGNNYYHLIEEVSNKKIQNVSRNMKLPFRYYLQTTWFYNFLQFFYRRSK